MWSVPETPQGALDGGLHVCGAAVDHTGSAAGVGDEPELGGDLHLIAAAVEGLADDLLTEVGTVDLGGVDVGDTEIKGPMDGADGLVVVEASPGRVDAGHGHRAEADAGDFEAPEVCVLHVCLSACGAGQACEVGMAHSSAMEERRWRVTMYAMLSAMSSGCSFSGMFSASETARSILDGVVVVRDQLGLDGTGLEHADPDMLLRDFLAKRFGEAVHSELRHVVRGEVRPRLPAGDRGDVHDVRDAAQFIFGGGQQVRQRGLGHEEQAVLVDRDHPLPFLDVLIDDGSEQHQPGVVDEDVEASEPVDDRLHGAFGLDAVGDVGGHGEGGAARGLDLGDEGV